MTIVEPRGLLEEERKGDVEIIGADRVNHWTNVKQKPKASYIAFPKYQGVVSMVYCLASRVNTQSISLPFDGCERISHNARSLTRFQFAYRILISIPLKGLK